MGEGGIMNKSINASRTIKTHDIALLSTPETGCRATFYDQWVTGRRLRAKNEGLIGVNSQDSTEKHITKGEL